MRNLLIVVFVLASVSAASGNLGRDSVQGAAPEYEVPEAAKPELPKNYNYACLIIRKDGVIAGIVQ